MSISNVYNQAGSSSEYFTLANQTHAVLSVNLGPCKIGVETDTGALAYTDNTGMYRTLVPTISGPAATLPPNLSGYLNNDGSGNLSWKNPSAGSGATLPTAKAGFLWDDGAGNNDWRLPTPSQIGAAPLNNPSFTGAPTLGNASASTINISGVSTFNSVSAVSLNVSGTATLSSIVTNAFAVGQQSIATAGSTTTLTVNSPQYTIFTGSLAQNVVLPDARTLQTGWTYEIDNASTQAVTLKDGTSATLWTLAAGTDTRLILTANGTQAGTWNIDYYGDNVATGKVVTFNNSASISVNPDAANVILSTPNGYGAMAFVNSPTLINPNLGAAQGLSLNVTANATLGSLSVTGVSHVGSMTVDSATLTNLNVAGNALNTSLSVTNNATLGTVSGGLIRSTGPILSSGGAVGYTGGVGGTISQAANKGSVVTLAKLCGQITMQNTALTNATTVSFIMNNALLLQNDMILINHQSVGTLGAYNFSVAPGNGIATISVRNLHTASLSEAIVLQFLVIRAAVV
jgi:hypothetical protein